MTFTTTRTLVVLSILITVLTLLACGTSAPAEPTAAPPQENMAEPPTKEAAQPEASNPTPVPMDQPMTGATTEPQQEAMGKETPASGSEMTGGPAFKMQDYKGLTFKQFAEPPPMTIDPNGKYTATLTTNMGTIVIDLFADSAPKTVNNFVFLAEDGFYDGLIFHRVIEDFMIQGGDPTGTGVAGPGYKFEDETSSSDSFDRPGLLAMANSGPNTNGSQFFITTVPTPNLNGRHTIFGEVVSGQDVAAAISKVGKDAKDRPNEPVTIESIAIAKSG